jgi:hypothetical protein
VWSLEGGVGLQNRYTLNPKDELDAALGTERLRRCLEPAWGFGFTVWR